MTDLEFHASQSYRSEPRQGHDAALADLTVPYAGQTRMRLTITSGMADAHVRIDPDAVDLLAIDCGGGMPPRLRISPSELRVSWPTSIGSWLRSALAAEYRDIEIVLHPAVEWTLLVRGGLSRFEADLNAGKLARVEIAGGVSEARFDLPSPTGAVPIRISGGVSNLFLRHPADAGIDLTIHGGTSGLRLDDQSFSAIGGAAHLTTGAIRNEAPHYAVEITGGANRLEIVPR